MFYCYLSKKSSNLLKNRIPLENVALIFSFMQKKGCEYATKYIPAQTGGARSSI